MSVPEGALVNVLDTNGHEFRLSGNDWLLALPEKKGKIHFCVTYGNQTQEYLFELPFSMSKLSEGQACQGLELYQTVLSWASFFDECLIDEQGGTSSASALAWADIDEKLRDALDNPDKPQMSLIVRISEALYQTIEAFERGIRRVLTRDRRMMPADKAEEFDPASIDWYIRQPGLTAAEKAAYNQQRLKAVARQEFVDTLENRVLKDFLLRCVSEANDYWIFCTDAQKESNRARNVRKFGRLCKNLLQLPAFEAIASIRGIVQPNYVLQGDPRYRKIWRFYQLLLRKQRAADFLWAWQTRLWSDVVSVSVNIALWRMAKKKAINTAIELLPIAESGPELSFEQHEGRRVSDVSDAGPWLLRRRGNDQTSGQIVEVVSSARLASYLEYSESWQCDEKKELIPLRTLREATVLLLTPLSYTSLRRTLLIIWPLHTEADGKIDRQDIVKSMLPALQQIERSSRKYDLSAYGLAISSDSKPDSFFEKIEPATIFSFGSRPAQWAENLATLELWLSSFFEEILR